jgi:hypothetical protein
MGEACRRSQITDNWCNVCLTRDRTRRPTLKDSALQIPAVLFKNGQENPPPSIRPVFEFEGLKGLRFQWRLAARRTCMMLDGLCATLSMRLLLSNQSTASKWRRGSSPFVCSEEEMPGKGGNDRQRVVHHYIQLLELSNRKVSCFGWQPSINFYMQVPLTSFKKQFYQNTEVSDAIMQTSISDKRQKKT